VPKGKFTALTSYIRKDLKQIIYAFTLGNKRKKININAKQVGNNKNSSRNQWNLKYEANKSLKLDYKYTCMWKCPRKLLM
jgi:hypothetical protein